MAREWSFECKKTDARIKNKSVKKKYLTDKRLYVMMSKVIKMDEILKQSLLYDFYGELLTEHQKEIYEQFIVEDLSLSEIAKDAGISRQGVHDLIKRCNKILEEYEEKLHLVEKFLSVKEKVHQLNTLLEDNNTDESQLIQKIRKISGEIIEEL
jgi:predicted DNA-binding protein YlxM (UPF0122 family)